jgi:hypothetical protein
MEDLEIKKEIKFYYNLKIGETIQVMKISKVNKILVQNH